MTRLRTARRLRVGRLVALMAASALGVAGAVLVHRLQVRGHASAILDRAAAAAGERNFDAAAKLFREYLNFRPKDPAALSLYAEALEKAGPTRPGVAGDLVGLYERLRTLDSLAPDQRRRLAYWYLALNQVAAARDNLGELARAGAADAELHELTATCDERERKFPQAIEGLRAAVATGQASADGYLRLALLLRGHGDRALGEQQADAVLAALIKLRPDDVPARLARFGYFLRHDQRPKARAEAEYAYKAAPGGDGDPEVALALALSADSDADWRLAREALTKALAKSPADPRLATGLAEVQLRAGDPAAAAKTLAQAALAHPRLDAWLTDTADQLCDLGDFAAAEQVAARVAADGTPRAFADYLRARAALGRGDWPRAQTLFKQANAAGLDALRPQYVRSLVGLADCAALANLPAERGRLLDMALRYEPQSVPARLGQAELLAQAGQTARALEIYAALAPTVPAARLAVCGARLAEVAAKPEGARDWAALDAAFGPEPQPPGVELLRANALMMRNRLPEALALLERTAARPDAANLPGPRVALAVAKSSADPSAGLPVLDAAEKAIGDRAEFRIARATLLLRLPDPDTHAVLALGNQVSNFTPAERSRLLVKLADILLDLGKRGDAIGLLTRAADDNPFDLAMRVRAFDLAVAEKDTATQARMLAELDRLEGPDGPVRAVVEVARRLGELKPGSPELDALRARVEAARAKRETWGPVHALLGAIDQAAGRGDAALGHYRRAIELGESGEPVVRNAVELMLERQGQREALDLLTRLGRAGTLSVALARQLELLRTVYGEETARGLAWARRAETEASKDYREQLARATVFEYGQARDEAKRAIEKAVALDPARPEGWLALVRVLVASDDKAGAEAALAKAQASLKPKADDAAASATAALTLGSMHELLGRPAEAEAGYTRALELLPNDPPIVQQLTRFYRATGRPRLATALFESLTAPTRPADIRRWARRNLAFERVAESAGQADLAAALALIDANIQEAGANLEDTRARALVQATDPFQQPEAIKSLVESATRTPLTPDQNFYLARMYRQQGAPDKAEQALREATSAAAVPEHLFALGLLQLERGGAAPARETANRLKAVAPRGWEAASLEARLLHAAGRPADAARLLAESPFAKNPAAALERVAPLLEELKLNAAAEALYRKAAAASTPDAHFALANFLLRQQRAPEALALTTERAAGTPTSTTAKLFSNVARVRPLALVPAAERAAWGESLKAAEAWVRERLAREPQNRDLPYALAELADAFGRYDEALKLYESALAAGADQPATLNNAAMLTALQRRDGGDRPMALINALITRNGPKPTWLDTRAMVHLQGGRFDEAVRDLAVAAALDPRPAIHYHLALAHDKRAATTPDSAAARDRALDAAKQRGLTRGALHALEWPEYERLTKGR